MANIDESKPAVLVTGAGGSIGAEVSLQLYESSEPFDLVINDISEPALFEIQQKLLERSEHGSVRQVHAYVGDISNPIFSSLINRNHRIQRIYHAAAYKHVNLSQHNPLQYYLNNLGATKSVLEIAESNGAILVHVSTDKAVRPTNVMGKSKRLCELYLLTRIQEGTSASVKIVRFGNVLNSNGSVIPIFQKQIETGGPVTVTHKDATRFFMSISDAVNLVLQVGRANWGEIINVLDMERPIGRQLTRSLVEQQAKEWSIERLVRKIQITYWVKEGETSRRTLYKLGPTSIGNIRSSVEGIGQI